MTATILATMLALATAGPSVARPTNPPNRAEAAVKSRIAVSVDNHNFLDVRVFAVSGGFTYRLGTVTGQQRSTFTLPEALSTQGTSLQLIFAPIGSRGYWVTQPVLVSPGDQVSSEVGSTLNMSTVWVR